MRKSLMGQLLAASAAGLLAGCGGGGAGGVESTPPPPPPHHRRRRQTGSILAPGVTTTTDFAVTGYERGAGDTTVADLATSGFTVRYDAASQSYLIALPSFGGGEPGAFSKTSQSAQAYFGTIPDSTGTAHVIARNPASGPYQYSTVATIDSSETTPNSVFAFGLATPDGAVPITGTATYAANLAGAVFGVNYGVEGTASFAFDFAAGTLGGSMSPVVIDGWGIGYPVGPYTFNNAVYSAGSTSFAGAMTHSTNNLTGAFSGRFTGPVGQELIGRFNLQFADPYASSTETMYGAFVGRKQ
jgi:hypothetical protein